MPLSRCPEENETLVEVTVIDIGYDEDMGQEIETLECPNGHTWTKPTLRSIVRSFAYGPRWRQVAAEREGP
jgi:hypothetical protein